MPSSMPVASKPRPYRRFLTSALHTRFVHAAGIALLWHLTIAGLASDWYSSISSFFWAFFPIGAAGIKALLFSLSSLLIFMLQIGTMNLGKRCTPSNWTSIRTVLLSYSTYLTLFWYMASAWWFCEVFVFTSPTSKELGWIINGGYGAPDKLNERPIYLRMFFLLLGVVQAIVHVYNDYSSLLLHVRPPKKPGDQKEADSRQMPVINQLLERGPALCKQAALVSGACTVAAPFLYTAFFRRSLWSWHIWWAKAFANIARSDAVPPQGLYVGSIMLGGALFGILLVLTWQLNILLFEVYMLEEPTKDNVPLSTLSKDPNGSLLNGLKAKRALVQTFAFWELDIIAHKYAPRRKDIFSDFERPGQGPIFTAMVDAALGVLKAIEIRMNEVDPPPHIPAAASLEDKEIQKLPRILPNAVPAKTPITQSENPANLPTRFERVSHFVSQEAKRVGNSPRPWSPPVDRTKQLALEYSSPKIKELQARVDAAQRSPVGRYLLTNPTRLIKSAILGSPTANPAIAIHAVNSITTMLIASLQEDTYGKAVQNVPPTVQTFTKSIYLIEAFVHKHTAGGAVSPRGEQDLREVNFLYQTLKSRLRELLSAFKIFLSDVGLSIRDLNEAQKAADDRDLFRVITPTSMDAAVSEGLADRVRLANGAAGNTREMQDVSHAHQQRDRQRQGAELRWKAPQQDAQQRPGRLFSQLDPGSPYSDGLRKRGGGVAQGEVLDASPLVSGSFGQKCLPEPTTVENPFGARNLNPLPPGGLQKGRLR